MKYGLTEKQLKEIISFIAQYYEVEEAILFGSRAIDTYKEASDVDIALKGKDVTAGIAAKMKFNIEEDTYLPFFFDFVAYPTITNQDLKKHIDTKGVVIFKKRGRGLSEWKECRLGDVLLLFGGGTPKTSNPEYWNGSIPWLSVTDFNNGRKYCYTSEKTITEKGLRESSTKILKKGQLIISARGTVGVVAMLGNDMAFNQSNYGIDANSEYTCNDFLYYWLKNALTTFLYNAYGAVFNTITKATFDSLTIKLPPLPEQLVIASVLSSLDDKIDLLHRQNKTLEAMAETIFRQWFAEEVDWNGVLSEYIKVQGGYAFKSADFKEIGNNGIIKITNISMDSINIVNTQFVDDSIVKSLDSNKFKIISGDILIAMTGAEIGKIGIVEKTEKSLWLNQRVGKLIPNVIYGEYIGYLALKSPEGQDYIINACAGSAQENISSSKLEEMKFVSYSKKKTESFGQEVKPFFEKIIFNQKQISTLSKLRDTLLPKLMSGEVRVNF